MKKIALMVVTFLVAISLTTAASAEETLKVKGTVIKKDEAAKSVTIKTKAGEEVMVVMEDADMLGKVKEGGKAEAKYVVKDGKNVGSKLRRLTQGCE
jgi:hypothetical protein